jgi:hypothetical protein
MEENNRTESGHDKRLGQLEDLLLSYLTDMDSVKPSRKTIFRTEGSKVDLENKVWHYFHKVEATVYHCHRVEHLTAMVREELSKMIGSTTDKLVGNESELRVAIQDRKILYEVDAFFAAGRSALDFLASVLSRYIRGKDTDRFRTVTEFLHDSSHPVAALVNQAWAEWAEDFIIYRDYLLHHGALPTPSVVQVTITRSKARDPALLELAKMVQGEQARPIVFPLPTKPNPKMRLTREDMLWREESRLPMGVSEIRTTITLSPQESDKGPEVSVSLGRSFGSMSVGVTSESSLGKKSNSVRSVKYELEPGYIEANTLCQDLYGKLMDLGLNVLSQLAKVGFTHVA